MPEGSLPLTLITTALVCWLPGVAIVMLLRLTRLVDALLIPALAWLAGLLVLAPLAVIVMLGGLDITAASWMWGAVTAVLVLGATLQHVRRRRRSRAEGGGDGEVSPPRVRTSWEVRTLLWTSIAFGGLALLLGGTLDGDTLYHVSVSLKLQHLDQPSAAGIQMFRDGSPHPGYIIPATHLHAAIAAHLAGAQATLVYWIIPALLVPMGMLAFGGLGRALLRSDVAALITGLAFVWSQVLVLSEPQIFAVRAANWPGQLVLTAVVPLMLVSLMQAAWARESRARWASVALLVPLTCLVIVLHSSYLVWILLTALGYLVAMAVLGRVTRDTVRRHSLAAAAVFVPGAVGLAALAPLASKIGGVGEKAGTSDLAFKDWWFFRRVLVGTPDLYHLRPDLLARFGAISLLGIIGMVLALRLLRRDPVGWLLGGSLAAVFAVALVSPLFTTLSTMLLISQTVRLGTVPQVELGIAVLVIAIAAMVAGLLEAGRRGAAVGVGAGAAGIGLVMMWAWRPLSWRFAPERLPAWAIWLTAAVLLAVIVHLTYRRLRRLDAAADVADDVLDHEAPIGRAAPGRSAIALALLLVVTIPTTVRAALVSADDIAARPSTPLKVDRMASIDGDLVEQLGDLPTGTVVAIRTIDALALQAAVPVYTSSYPKGNTANTRENRRTARTRATSRLLRRTDSELGILARLRIIDGFGIEYVVTRSGPEQEAIEHFATLVPGSVTLVWSGPDQSLYEVDREVVADELARRRKAS